VVEGQAYLQIVDPSGQLDGQAITRTAQVYFLTYDINYLAQVGQTVALGAEIRSTDYFVVDFPKTVGNVNGLIVLTATVKRLISSATSRNIRTRWSSPQPTCRKP